jgi:pSer/pThr/pTyr-binding forkhead associated (FHA) protein
VSLEGVDLSDVNLEGVKWEGLRSVNGTNVYGVRGAPAGFVEWALRHGAVAKKEEE